jgi:glyoxylase-like metal-dependent hydrolase (beta-lactamase superfamily II)/rhodanese-related sulfurtransferase
MKHVINGLPAGVILLRYEDRILGHASYLLADLESATAVVVDPQRNVDPYLEDAGCLGARIKHVLLTQVFTEFSSGALELRERACAMLYRGAWAPSDLLFMPLKDGDTFEFGRTRLRILETPGHRLESIVILVADLRSQDVLPYAALTGETVASGDVGRPEPGFEDGYGIHELAEMLYGSLRSKVLHLPRETRLFSSLGGGETVDRDGGTLEEEERLNPGLQDTSCEEFVRRMTCGMTDPPPAGPESVPSLRGMPLEELLELHHSGVQVVDDRDPARFAAGHLKGSINLPFAAGFEPWAGVLLERRRPVVLITPPGREQRMAERLAMIGFGSMAGYLEGGMEALEGHGDLVTRRRRLSFAALAPRVFLEKEPTLLLDTRAHRRERLGPTFGACPLPLEDLPREMDALPRTPEIIVCDDSPYRSSAAASLLGAAGFDRVTEVAGGLALWGRYRPWPAGQVMMKCPERGANGRLKATP